MNVHQNARLTPKGREAMVERVLAGEAVSVVAEAVGVDVKTVRKWVARYREQGASGLRDRSSRPHRCPGRTPPDLEERVLALRRQRWTGARIAAEIGRATSTVFRILARHDLGRLCALEPAEPPRRYERENPGDMIHIDIKKLGRFARIGHRITGDRKGQSNGRGIGWEFVHVCVDDASRIAFAEIMPDERQDSAVAFLQAALAYYARLGVTVRRVMTDNGSCYRSAAFRKACADNGIKHVRTRPYTPRTNGKAERFIQTAMREWAYARAYETSEQRARHLAPWLRGDNWLRPHHALKLKTPISRLPLTEDNLSRLHTS